MPRRTKLSPLHLLAGAIVLAGCDGSPAAPGVEPSSPFASAAQALEAHGDLLRSVRQQTARFNSTIQATRAGYVADAHCVAHPELGGMGYHWLNRDLIDPVYEPLEPEVLLYAAGAGGNLRLVAVEYIVIDVGQPHPDFDGHLFDVGGVPPLAAAGIPHWSLHVWVHEENPNGLFAPFNPNVTCN